MVLSQATRRRERQSEPLAHRESVKSVLEELRRELAGVVPAGQKQLMSMLRAAGQLERGRRRLGAGQRKSRWQVEDLARVTATLRRILQRETSGRIGVRSFIEHYLQILAMPEDVVEALESGKLNLFEAEQLARLKRDTLALSAEDARVKRRAMLATHLETGESGNRLRERVNAMLRGGELQEPAKRSTNEVGLTEEMSLAIAEIEAAVSDVDPTDLFYDYLVQMVLALRATDPHELTEAEINQLFASGDELLNILHRAKLRKQNRAAKFSS